MKKSIKVHRLILRILGSLAFIGYILFLIGEGIQLFKEASFADVSVYLLFAVFLAGYLFLWKNELISGILFIAWHGLQWSLVLWVWVDGEMSIYSSGYFNLKITYSIKVLTADRNCHS